nr:transposase [uncultured Capnocytophaga sp.]
MLKKYKRGCSAYHPRTMIKILFYGYLSNIYSCDKITQTLNENICFMYLLDYTTADFKIINNLSKILKESVKTLFSKIIKLFVE